MDFKKRSNELEIMDDLEMEGDELASTLRQIAMVNKYLGGTNVVLAGIKKLLKGRNPNHPISIIDLGCGGGEILRKIADWGAKQGISLELIGIDANAFIVDYAAKLSKDYPNISYRQLNVFSPEFEALEYDIALCSLFLHHFKDEEIIQLLTTIKQSAKIGLLVNDLERSKLAHFLFDLVTRVLGASHMVRFDGKLSIRRAFRQKELKYYLKKANIQEYKIQWKWAFRYQIVVKID